MNRRLTASTDVVTDSIIGAALEVHRRLGPGLLESAYTECLCRELAWRGVPYRREIPLALSYRGVEVPIAAYRIDLLVADAVVVEVKAQERLIPLYQAQVLTYLRLGSYSRGLLINFGTQRLADGIKRIVNGWVERDPLA